MPTIQKNTIKTEVCFSETKDHRFLLRKEWDKTKKKATVIMNNPSIADWIVTDYTTMYVINNLARLDFGTVDIVNIFSRIDLKVNLQEELEELISKENNSFIQKSAEKSDYIIIAWGRGREGNKKVKSAKQNVLELLKPYQDKIYVIENSSGKQGFHPLAPQIRHEWKLVKMNMEINKQ